MLDLLKAQKAAIEQELAISSNKNEMRQDCRVSICLNNVDPEDQADCPRQHEWLAKQLNDMHRVLAPRVSALDAA